jgi:hypothetical protein
LPASPRATADDAQKHDSHRLTGHRRQAWSPARLSWAIPRRSR